MDRVRFGSNKTKPMSNSVTGIEQRSYAPMRLTDRYQIVSATKEHYYTNLYNG